MDDKTFNKFRALVFKKSGIYLRENKKSLLLSRLGKRMRDLDIKDHKDYLNYILNDNSGQEIVQFLDVITTNVTSFFREEKHFEVLTQYMKQWLGEGQRKFRFWSAACSSGEEPYSTAITLLEATKGYQVDMKILATDLSTRILASAKKGVYTEDKISTVKKPMLSEYFKRVTDEGQNLYIVKDSVKSIISFNSINLSTPPFKMKGPFDAVFCRNVMIYFNNDTKSALLKDIARLLKLGGILFVGHAESLTGQLSELKAIKPSVYFKEK
ncbi:MAG: methyltransferase domain-containing protein [Nitrospirae bacterium]|nr:methyltransferase domain-containing protein [Nitrospirota bacterium]